MPPPSSLPPLDRRALLAAGLVVTAGTAAQAGTRTRAAAAEVRPDALAAHSSGLGLQPDSDSDQSAALQAAIDKAHEQRASVLLPPGRFHVGAIQLRPRTRLIGHGPATRLVFTGGAHFLAARDADEVTLQGLLLDGAGQPLGGDDTSGLVSLARCARVLLSSVGIEASPRDGLSLVACSGRVTDCSIRWATHAGLRSLDATGLDITHNTVTDCANNGILVWRRKVGEDGTRVSGNRIARILASAGGTGENGNGINVFRAGGVLVSDNRITDCAYSAIRGNGASNIQMVGNSCARLGEVALYAEFGFEGALIASNLVDGAACAIEVTNFNEGGRLAVIQGNLIRNLFRREHEQKDKRGEGITVEADAVVSANTIEGAPTCGILVGTGRYQRDVVVTGNLVRAARVGIMVSADRDAGACALTGNMISGCRDGAIRAHDHRRPVGPDLARAQGQAASLARLALSGNVTV